MRIAIMGTGGVGGYFGGLLANAGEDVTFIARGSHLQAIQSSGLQVNSVHGDFHIRQLTAVDDPSTVGPVDFILLATKTHQVKEAAETMRPLVGSHTTILPLQNGVDTSEQLIELFGPQPVLGGACYIFSFLVKPGVIEQTSEVRRIILGELDGTISERVKQLGDTLTRSGAQAIVSDNINKARWDKFLFVAPLGVMGAATRVPVGEMLACTETRQLLASATKEVKALAAAHHIEPDEDVVETMLAIWAGMPPDARTSLQRDMMAGRPSELEAQCGYVVRRGAELGVPVPVHTCLYSILLPQENVARGA